MITDEEIRASLLKDIGVDMHQSNELFFLIKILYTQHKENLQSVQSANETMSELNKTIQKKKLQQIHFDNNKEAFWHGLGKFGLALITGIIAISFLIVYYTPIHKANTVNVSFNDSLIEFSKKHNPQLLKTLKDDYDRKQSNK
jgi:hypothetical protein